MTSQGRLTRVTGRVRAELHASLTADTTPRQVATSFAIGTFVTMLPTLGTGLLVFFVLVYLFDWINRVALFASVLVFNPAVKWGVYALSFALGFALLGPVEGVSLADRPGPGDGSDILFRLLVGNTILAVIATVVAYVVAYRIASAYDAGELPVIEHTVEHVAGGLEQHEDRIDGDRANSG